MLVTTWSLSRLRGTPTIQPSCGSTDEETIQTLRDGGNAQWLYSFGQAQTLVSFILGDIADARRWQAFTEPFAPAGVCLFSQPDYHLFRALLLLDPSSSAGVAEREQALAELAPDRDKLQRWADACPQNFAHKHWLLSAEIARALAKPVGDVLSCYEAALTAAGDDFIQFSALIYELQGRYLASLGQARLGRLSMQRAFRLYQNWGAQAKLQRLVREFPELSGVGRSGPARLHRMETATTEGKLDLDLASVLKATRAISSEVRPERLFRTLMDTIIENAGAELGCLVLKGDAENAHHIAAWASVDPSLAASLEPTSLDDSEHVCRDVVRYVIRTHESVVLDDAAGGGAYEGDLYIQRRAVRSLLCIPVLNQGVLLAVLYAENNAARCAFTKDRIEILSMIASQAAISINNALLYQNLEQKVEERTRELAEKNLEMGAMLDGMEQGIFTIDEKLKIQPQYSVHLERLLGTSRLSGNAFMPLLFRGAALRPDQLAATETALRFSFDVPSFLAEANLSHAVRSFEVALPDGGARFLEVDWNLIVGEQGLVSKILVAVRDVTMVRRLEELARRREREADIVSQVLDSGLQGFRQFFTSAQHLLDQCQQLLAADRNVDADAIRALFRNVHTIKGNARLFGFSHIVDVVHQVEDVYSELRSGRGELVERGELVADIERVAASVREYEQVCARKLAPLAQTRDARLEQAASELHGLLEDPAARTRPEELLARIKSSLDRLRSVPLAELVKETSRMFPSLAKELCKSVPLVECRDEGMVLNHEWAEVMREVFVHAFRNSLAHGIEAADERTARGKNPQGTLSMRAERNEHAIVVRLSDDGKGLAVDQLRQQTGRLEARDEELAEVIFSSGISTVAVVSRVAGRGVGMDLIRSAVRKLGGDAKIAFTAEPALGYRHFELVLSLPVDGAVPKAASQPMV
jgi:HPt (histidine-containing phosphotransfer) domain-containing protein